MTVAIRLYRSPGLARSVRSSALPPAILFVIRIAAGCPISCTSAARETGLDEPTLMRVATLYLLIALFGQETDPYRTLGVVAGASTELVQDHKKWLLKWLHPDRNANQNLAGLSVRVLAASAALAASQPQVGALESDQQLVVPAMHAFSTGAEQQKKRQLRHVWVPMRVDG